MKLILSTALIGLSSVATAQINLAAKANLLFPTGSPSWKNISNTAVNAYNQNGKNNVGFNIGLSLQAPLHGAFFLMPEVYYSNFSNEFTDPVTNTTIKAKYNRIDVPVLLGYKILGENIGVFVGPVGSYNLSTNDTYNDFKENAKNNFTVGYQFGAQASFSRYVVDARYEGAFSSDQRDYVSALAGNYTVRYDSRPSLFIVGLGYKF